MRKVYLTLAIVALTVSAFAQEKLKADGEFPIMAWSCLEERGMEMDSANDHELDYLTTKSAQGRYLKVYIVSNWGNTDCIFRK